MHLPRHMTHPHVFPLILWDGLAVPLAFSMALVLRFDGLAPARYWQPLVRLLPFIVLLYCLANLAFGLYAHLWRYASAQEVVTIVGASAASTLLLGLAILLTGGARPLPLSVILLGGLFCPGLFTAVRYRRRLLTGVMGRVQRLAGSPDRQRVLIVGAGEAGQFVARQLHDSSQGYRYELAGFVDDDPAKRGLRVQGAPVLGDRQAIPHLVAERGVGLIVIALHNVAGPVLRDILTLCLQTPARVKLKPDFIGGIDDPAGGAPLLRDVTPADLLGREPHTVDEAACRGLVRGKVVLVTGAAGSIGSELCRQIAGFGPGRLLMLDNNETGLYDLKLGLKAQAGRPDTIQPDRLVPVIADVTHAERMDMVFARYRPQIVFHAAAYKHVPLMEAHPGEAIRVNVLGARRVAKLAAAYGAERFVLISSDKAVHPSSIMGATKRLGEMILAGLWQEQGRARPLQANGHNGFKPANGRPPNGDTCRLEQVRPTLFTAVRFGNVLGSRGSVVPTFLQQIDQGGPVTITHPEMSRYFMSIPEAVSLVIQAATQTEGGDIFMLDMGQEIRIADLAHKLIRLRGLRPNLDIPIVYTGVRPGEKLREELITPDETRQPTVYPKIFRIRPQALPWRNAELASLVSTLVDLAQRPDSGPMLDLLWQLVRAEPVPVAPGQPEQVKT